MGVGISLRVSLFLIHNPILHVCINTSIHFFVSIGSFLVLLLFTSLSTEKVTITSLNPSLITYNDLQELYSQTLRCPCSTTTIQYEAFISLSPILHQVCSSGFVKDPWLSTMTSIATFRMSIDWRNRAFSQFQLLSDLCQLSKKTTNDAVQRFLLQSFVASSVLPKTDFDRELNVTLNQFYQSTTTYFDLLVETVHLLMQVDQPYMESPRIIPDVLDTNLLLNIIKNATTNQYSFLVCLSRNIITFPFLPNSDMTIVKILLSYINYCQKYR